MGGRLGKWRWRFVCCRYTMSGLGSVLYTRSLRFGSVSGWVSGWVGYVYIYMYVDWAVAAGSRRGTVGVGSWSWWSADLLLIVCCTVLCCSMVWGIEGRRGCWMIRTGLFLGCFLGRRVDWLEVGLSFEFGSMSWLDWLAGKRGTIRQTDVWCAAVCTVLPRYKIMSDWTGMMGACAWISSGSMVCERDFCWVLRSWFYWSSRIEMNDPGGWRWRSCGWKILLIVQCASPSRWGKLSLSYPDYWGEMVWWHLGVQELSSCSKSLHLSHLVPRSSCLGSCCCCCRGRKTYRSGRTTTVVQLVCWVVQSMIVYFVSMSIARIDRRLRSIIESDSVNLYTFPSCLIGHKTEWVWTFG